MQMPPALIQQMQMYQQSGGGRPMLPNRVRLAMEYIGMLQQKDISAMHVACHTEGVVPAIKVTDKERASHDAACHVISQYFMGEIEDVMLEVPDSPLMSLGTTELPSPLTSILGEVEEDGSVQAGPFSMEPTSFDVESMDADDLAEEIAAEFDDVHPITMLRQVLATMGVDSGSAEQLIEPYKDMFEPEDE